MNILVIGNGFDLAHGLLTKYTDFLEFASSFLKYDKEESSRISWDSWFKEETVRCYIKKLFEEQSNEGFADKDNTEERKRIRNNAEKAIQDLKELLSNNVWLEYFLEKRDEMAENGLGNWIDFEEELSKVIQSLDKDIHNKDKNYNIDSITEDLTNDFLKKKFLVRKQQSENEILNENNKISFRCIRDKLLEDLNKLIRALEIYLAICVKGRKCEALPLIKKINPDFVLSFNYTDTYEYIYGKTADVDYIHGTVNSTQEKENNMVLGIDEYLSKKRKDKDLEFIYFKKYYQRIYKQTGCDYKHRVSKIQKEYKEYVDSKKKKKKLQNIHRRNGKNTLYELGKLGNAINRIRKEFPECNVYFFGHSLDVTDKDIIRDLILNDNINTTIYAYDREAMGKQIVNLVKVIGQSELIKRTGGNKPKIKFKILEEENKKNKK